MSYKFYQTLGMGKLYSSHELLSAANNTSIKVLGETNISVTCD